MWNRKTKKSSEFPTLAKQNISELKSFVLEWNTNFPIDRWWRKKHNVAFNSLVHREVSFVDMRFEWEEDKLYEKIYSESDYTINSGNYMKEKRKNEIPEQEQVEQFKDLFNKTDLSQYDSL